MVQGKINRGRHTDHLAGATPCGLTIAHLHHPPFLQARCPSCRPTNSVKALRAGFSGLGSHGNQQRSWKVLENDDNIMEFLQVH